MIHDYPPLKDSYMFSLTIFRDNNISVGTAVFMNVINSLLHTVHHLDTALQIPVFCTQRFHL